MKAWLVTLGIGLLAGAAVVGGMLAFYFGTMK